MLKIVCLCLFVFSSLCLAEKEDLARHLFRSLAGAPLLSGDPRLSQMNALLVQNKWREASQIATEDDGFFHTTIRDWAAVMSNRKESPFVPFNDFEAFVIGVVRDGIDARQFLTGNFRYEAPKELGLPPVTLSSSAHYLEMEAKGINYRKTLVKRVPQWDEISDTAGLLTTYTWASEHLIAGTNRRSTEYTFQEFLCTPLSVWKDFGLPEYRIRRDVSRSPSGNSSTFQNECRNCHAPMDAMTGAFANFDFAENQVLFSRNWIAPKMNQNGNVFPNGYTVKDASWLNFATEHHNESFGWRSATEGVGVHSFGEMVSQSKGFSNCMVRRVYKKVCREELTKAALVEHFANLFEAESYDLKNLFESIAIHCAQEKRI